MRILFSSTLAQLITSTELILHLIYTELSIMPNERRYVFQPNLERVYLGCLFLFLVFFIFSLIHKDFFWNQSGPFQNIVVKLLFFNTLHTSLSVIFLISLPEFRSWLKEYLSFKRSIYSVTIISLIFAFSINTIYALNFQKFSLWPYVAFIILSLKAIHNISQTKGISLLYNKLLCPLHDPTDQDKATRTEKRERFLFNAFIIQNLFSLFIVWFNDIAPNYSLLLNCGLGLLLTAALSTNAQRYPQVNKTYKRQFLAGNIFHAFKGSSVSASLLQQALHGLEYTYLSYSIVKKSSVQKQKISLLITMILVTSFTIISTIVVTESPLASSFLSDGQLKILSLITFFVGYIHYWLDSQFFQFRLASVRSHIYPLVLPTNQIAGEKLQSKMAS